VGSLDPTRVKLLGDFAGRAALVALFVYLATTQMMGVVASFHDPGAPQFLDLATRLVSIAFLVLVVCLAVVRLRPIRSAEGFEPRLSALAGTFLSVALVALPLTDVGTGLRVTSLILIAAGWILSIWVLLWLGRAFSIMAQARRLVTTGPYAIVRHPLYLFEELTVLGMALTHLSVAAVLIVAVQWMFQLRRMANEEKVLGAAFPEYATYAARTPKVLPRLFRA
jgi:protein-S-isoprenylcysteine O-methyltransferase Ste14